MPDGTHARADHRPGSPEAGHRLKFATGLWLLDYYWAGLKAMMWVGVIGIPGRAALVINPVRDGLYDDVGYVAFHLEVVDGGYIGVAESDS